MRIREVISRRLGTSNRRWLLAAAAALLAAALIAGVATTTTNRAKRHEARARQASASGSPQSSTQVPAPGGRAVTVDIDASHARAAVPADFLGLSFETVALPDIAASARSGNLAQLLRSLGAGTLRLGGVSADTRAVRSTESATSPKSAADAWESGAISRRNLAAVATLARRTGWNVLLTVNLGRYNPAAAAQEAAAAHALLGPKLAGIEIGNEPDRFSREGLRSPDWGFSAYRREFAAYRTAIGAGRARGPDCGTGRLERRTGSSLAECLRCPASRLAYRPLLPAQQLRLPTERERTPQPGGAPGRELDVAQSGRDSADQRHPPTAR